MRAVVQRVTDADVSVDNKITGAIGKGYVVLLGVEEGDTEADADYMVEKITGLRVFEDDEGKMNLSMMDVGGELLSVSQFTLLADARKGRRPSFVKAARPDEANRLTDISMKKYAAKVLKLKRAFFRLKCSSESIMMDL